VFKVPENVKSKYEFVILAAKRAEQLQMGAVPRVDTGSNKVTVIAQQEVAEGKINLHDPEQEAELQAAAEEE
jgi:DNA-directed RNA polymerase subunit omega